ncbi:serine hydrolase [Diaporthe helianthi]|uniref:Serine hydrolase n=1 Tax=Diaporthe helianthi TaxID=158607 RepID=A0A2P5IFA8_DIAHE|nr:serine hydrolase [Diaporthe helianthi]
MAGGQGVTTSTGLAEAGSKDKTMREVKILMLHGYTQSGPLFRAKTRALEKLLAKSLAPARIQPTLFYPTAPSRLSPKDIPGFRPSSGEAPGSGGGGDDDGSGGGADSQEMDAWAWFRRDEASGNYRLLREGFESLARCIRDEAGGHVDGVVGFSQGGAVAAMLASVLEHVGAAGTGAQGQAQGQAQRQPPPGDDTYDWSWVPALREANGGRALRFAVVYSGFFAPPPALAWLYEPKIRTPTLQFIGSLDTVVEEGRSRGLEERSENPVMVVHPGGHYVPVNRQFVMPLVGFIKQCCEDSAES